MLAQGPGLSPDERRWLALGVLSSALGALASGLVTWAIEAERERRRPKEPEGCWACTITAPDACPKHQGAS